MPRLYALLTKVFIMVFSAVSVAAATAQDNTQAARDFLRDHEQKIQPLQIENNRAWWIANTTGKDADFAAKEAAENKLNEALADPQQFARLKKIHEGKIGEPVLARVMEVLYLQYLEKSTCELCVPKTLCALISGGNRLTSAHHDRAAMFRAGRLGRVVQVEEPA